MIRKIARPMLASVYIADGVDTVVNTSSHVEASERFLKQLRTVLPAEYAKSVPQDPELVAQILGGTKIGAGTLYALGKAPRLSATMLAAAAIPTLIGRHAFWEAETPEEKSSRRNGALTNVALLGGLFLASADTAGKPGVAWRANKAAKTVNKKVQAALPTQSESEKAREQANAWLQDTADKVTVGATAATAKASDAGAKVSDFVAENKDDWIDTATKWVDSAVDSSTDWFDTARVSAQDWLDEVNNDTKASRKQIVKKANKAQDRAAKAYKKADKTNGRAAKRANKEAEKLQARATDAVEKARKKLDK
ncbi:DoxX family protein [Corynebacterium breve]|uniref:DoxX family protein n=1 Tax=Corynebacterium breve TaxID=3049799 RepID=A0ABY8VJE3_9CORY|nr:DoxX family protein [Corynebacterium breve]WIM68753.1 DoxX family protein [Corynebacterium breve]